MFYIILCDADASVILNPRLFQALPGFLLAITAQGKIVYISENVSDYLGHSMVRD